MRYVNAAAEKYREWQAEKFPSRLHAAWQDVEPVGRFHTPYDVPGRTWLLPDAKPFDVNLPHVEIHGDGRYDEGAGWWPHADPSVPELKGTGDSSWMRLSASGIYVHDLCCSNDRGFVRGSGIGIICEPQNGKPLGDFTIERVSVLYPGRNCLRFAGIDYVVSPLVSDCRFYGAGSDGVYCERMNFATFKHVRSTNHGGRGFVLVNCGSAQLRVVAENVTGGLLLEDCVGCEIETSHVESFAGPGAEPGIILDNCRGCVVRASVVEDWSERKPTGILLRNGTTRCLIEPSMHAGVGLSVDDGGTRGNTIHRQAWPAWSPAIPWRVSSRRNTVIG
jgi:hypothetical protein